jgi:hypothetical protein
VTSSAPVTPGCNTDMLALLVIGSILWLASAVCPACLPFGGDETKGDASFKSQLLVGVGSPP